jgi:hypothetical protein
MENEETVEEAIDEGVHHLPTGIYGFSGERKNSKFFFSEETSHA